MGITFREAVAEVELGLIAGDQLPDIATAGLLEGYESSALATLAGQFGELLDPVEVEELWTTALEELNIPLEGSTAAARILVRAYARLVAEGELPPQLGASKIAGVHRIAQHPAATIAPPEIASTRPESFACSPRTTAAAISSRSNPTASTARSSKSAGAWRSCRR